MVTEIVVGSTATTEQDRLGDPQRADSGDRTRPKVDIWQVVSSM
jgi:hypothetical protein